MISSRFFVIGVDNATDQATSMGWLIFTLAVSQQLERMERTVDSGLPKRHQLPYREGICTALGGPL